MDAPNSGTGQGPAEQSAVPVDRVLVLRVNEAADTAKPGATKKPDERSSRALEWTKAVGMPLVTLIATVLGGYYFTSLTKEREAQQAATLREREVRESNERLYAQLLTQRESSDAQVRKDMFGVVIKSFLAEPKPGDWNTKVLQLELLANNFNQSLDLAPLFKDVARRLRIAPGLSRATRRDLQKRLDANAADLIFRQVTALAQRGYSADATVGVSDWKSHYGDPYIRGTIAKSQLVPTTALAPADAAEQIDFRVEVTDVDLQQREVEVRLLVYFPAQQLERTFSVGLYDFPMLDNTQLPYGLRASVVITEFSIPETVEDRDANAFFKLHLVVFPASSASFKERQDYDDILLDMLRMKSKPGLSESEAK